MEKKYKIVESAGGIVKNNKNQIALIRMDNVSVWGFPKGKIEKNENQLDAAIREIFEETGIKNIELIKKLCVYQRPAADGKPIMVKIHMFLFKTTQKTILPVKNDVQQAQWFNKEIIVDNLTLSEDKDFFKKIKNEI